MSEYDKTIGEIIVEEVNEFNKPENFDMELAKKLKNDYLVNDKSYEYNSARLVFNETVNTEIGTEYTFHLNVIDKQGCIEALIFEVDENDNAVKLITKTDNTDVTFAATSLRTRVIMVIWYASKEVSHGVITGISKHLYRINMGNSTLVKTKDVTEEHRYKQSYENYLSITTDNTKSKIKRFKGYDADGDSIIRPKKSGSSNRKSTTDRSKNKAAKASRKKNR